MQLAQKTLKTGSLQVLVETLVKMRLPWVIVSQVLRSLIVQYTVVTKRETLEHNHNPNPNP